MAFCQPPSPSLPSWRVVKVERHHHLSRIAPLHSTYINPKSFIHFKPLSYIPKPSFLTTISASTNKPIMQKAWRVAQFITLGFSNFGWRGHKANAKNFTPGTLDVDLTGRHIVVTGATSGLGRVTAVALAARSATVHLVVRDAERGTALAEELTASGGNAVVHRCDLSSLKDVVEFIQKLNNDKIPVSVLVNNAGAMIHEVKETEDGFEMGFATNTLGTFALTEGIRPLLERTGRETKVTPRVVTVSSAGMLTEDLEIEDLAGKSLHKGEGNLDGAAQYARCKRRQVVLTEYWAERYKDGGIFWASMHPGWASTPGVSTNTPHIADEQIGEG